MKHSLNSKGGLWGHPIVGRVNIYITVPPCKPNQSPITTFASMCKVFEHRRWCCVCVCTCVSLSTLGWAHSFSTQNWIWIHLVQFCISVVLIQTDLVKGSKQQEKNSGTFNYASNPRPPHENKWKKWKMIYRLCIIVNDV